MATPRVIDFRPRYDNDELDRLAKEVGEVLAPVFEANGWRWAGEVPSAVEIALATLRLLQAAAVDEKDGLTIIDPIVVHRNREDELRVYLELGVVRAQTLTS